MDHRTGIGIALFLALFALMQTPSSQAQISNIFDTLKAQYLPAEYRNINLTLDDLKKIIRGKCGKVNTSNSTKLYNELEMTATLAIDCISQTANLTAIQDEIEAARPIGELDSVFHNYCSKVPVLENCVQNFTTKVQSCLTENERAQSAVVVRIFKNLVGFLCIKGGDQIALFVAEQGPECLEVNKEPLAHCLNSTMSEFMPKNVNTTDGNQKFDLSNLNDLMLSPKHCVDLERFEACTLHHLEQCQEITPANVAESVFRFIKTETNCTNWIKSLTTEKSILKSAVKSGANAFAHISFLLFSSITLISFALNKI